MLQQLREHGKKEGLLGFEQIQKIHLETHPFATFGCVTPTFKLIRNSAQKAFAKHIHTMYNTK